MRLLKLTLLLVLCACTHSVYAQRHYVGISAHRSKLWIEYFW